MNATHLHLVTDADALADDLPDGCFDFTTLRGQTVETTAARVHVFDASIRITALDGAGKRGARLAETSVCAHHCDQAGWVRFLDELRDVPVDGAFASVAAEIGRYYRLSVYERECRGIDVAPPMAVPVTLSTPAMSASFDFKGFSVSDLTDRTNEPRTISTERATGKRGVAKAYKLAKAGAFAACVTMGDVHRVLDANGIGSHSYCAMD